MANEVTVGVVGMIGTLVGGGITSLATYLNGKGQVRSAELAKQQERQDKTAEIGRGACMAFLTAVVRLLEDAREVRAGLEKSVHRDRLRKPYERYEQGWRDLVAVEAPLHIMGPDSVARSARKLWSTIGDYCEVIDAGYSSGSLPTTAEKVWEKVRAARQEFIAAAQEAYGLSATAAG